MLMHLNIETRSHHPLVDASWLDLTSNRVSMDAYQRQLVRVHGFEAPLEGALAYTPHLGLVVDLRSRIRSSAVVHDLLALGMRPQQIAELPQCRELVPFRTIQEALGWMYVAERATLLHGGVHRHLVSRLADDLNGATSYLRSYEHVVGSRWNELGRVLDVVARTEDIAQQIVDASHDAFRCQLRWYRDEHAGRREQQQQRRRGA